MSVNNRSSLPHENHCFFYGNYNQRVSLIYPPTNQTKRNRNTTPPVNVSPPFSFLHCARHADAIHTCSQNVAVVVFMNCLHSSAGAVDVHCPLIAVVVRVLLACPNTARARPHPTINAGQGDGNCRLISYMLKLFRNGVYGIFGQIQTNYDRV